MRTFDIEDVRDGLERLVDEVVAGEPFIVSVNGVPMAKFVAYDEAASGSSVDVSSPTKEP